jgi:hypothetical protein
MQGGGERERDRDRQRGGERRRKNGPWRGEREVEVHMLAGPVIRRETRCEGRWALHPRQVCQAAHDAILHQIGRLTRPLAVQQRVLTLVCVIGRGYGYVYGAG